MSKYSLDQLVDAVYNTGFVDGQNYAEGGTKDEAFVAKAKQQLLAGILSMPELKDEHPAPSICTWALKDKCSCGHYQRNKSKVKVRQALQDYFMGNGGDK